MDIAQLNLVEATKSAQALKAEGRLAESIAAHRRIVEAHPANAIALHNLASALGDAGCWAEAARCLSVALGMGLDAPETWHVLARSQQAIGQLDDAEASYRESARRRDSANVHRDLLQLRWMRTGDIELSLIDLDRALAQAPGSRDLILIKAQALQEAGRGQAGLELLLSAAAASEDGNFATIVAQTALAVGEIDVAARHASWAIARAPSLPAAHAVLVETFLATTQIERAGAAAADFRRRWPMDQHAIALQAVVWRLLADPRYADLYNYDALLRTATLTTPPGWPSLEEYLADLAGELKQAHVYRAHPFAQSIKGGSQAADLLQLESPAIGALPAALAAPLRGYIDALGAGHDPVRSRNLGNYAFQGMWSIQMSAGGRHINHVHPKGWISSACYVEMPLESTGREGWTKFGEPSLAELLGLEAERHIEPAPGRLVLFPSYMWHGTIPFSGDGMRLTFAFDLAPSD